MSAPRPLGVAIAGLGFGEKVHIPALRACPQAVPVALWHPRQERVEQASRAAELPGSSDFEQVLGDPAVEAVVIATPPAARFALAQQALLAGKHLLLEKPVALNATEAQQLEQLALERGLVCAVNFEYRAVPAFQQLAALLQQGWIGDPWLLRFDWLMGSRANPQRPWNWYSQQAQGGGVLGALGSHAFDMMQWLVGPIRQVQAQLSVAISERPKADGSGMGQVDAADTAFTQLQLEPQWPEARQQLSAQIALASTARQGRGCWMELYGSEGTLVLGSSNQSDYVHGFALQGSKGGDGLAPLPQDPSLSFARSWEDGRIAPVSRLIGWWAEAVRQQRPMVPGLLEGLASQQVMDACVSSHQTGQTMRLGL